MSLFIYHGNWSRNTWKAYCNVKKLLFLLKNDFFLSNGAFINDDIVAVAVKVKAKVLLQRIYMYMYQKLI